METQLFLESSSNGDFTIPVSASYNHEHAYLESSSVI